jgi:hypothetical protein
VLVSLLLLLAGVAMASAVARTSTTFDEIVLVSAGARALETGDWSMVVDQPPLMPLLYGLPVWASRPTFPDEGGGGLAYNDRWDYARDLYFRSGNDPGKLARLSRSVSVLLALSLILVVFAWGRRIGGAGVGLVAAALTAFFPDILAHGAVAYNDLPLALAYVGALWALDAAVRAPSLRRGALAGALVALAMGVKFSAVALGPAVVVLAAMEAAERRRDPAWWKGLGVAVGCAVVVGYLITALLYRWDPWLIWLEQGLRYTVQHAGAGHPGAAYLLGRSSADGWWYFFPVAFFLKTPAALHGMLGLATVGLVWGRRPAGGPPRPLLTSPLRAPAVGALVFLALLVLSGLNVGTRYALPAWVPLLVLVAAGLGRFSVGAGRLGRGALLALGVAYAASTLAWAPHFLAYRTEWALGLSPGREPLADSSVDWGQGLVALRDFQVEEGAGPVRLSYFGSALPEAYGVDYEALPSFLGLGPAPRPPGAPAPAFTVISLTNLHGLYFGGADPFAAYRSREPVRVLAGTLYVYREGGEGR